MPFDGTPPKGYDTATLLRRVQRFFGPKGRNWIRCYLTDNEGNYCLLGAIAHINKGASLNEECAISYLAEAIRERDPGFPESWQDDEIVSEYNDTADDFGCLASVLQRARELAEAASKARDRIVVRPPPTFV
jgi:hypothetical protein